MSTRLYVSNLSHETTLDDLNSLFGQVARVISVEIVTRPNADRSKDYGFVEIDAVSVEDVISKLGITEIDGRSLKIRKRQPGPPAVSSSGTSR